MNSEVSKQLKNNLRIWNRLSGKRGSRCMVEQSPHFGGS
jgi:hypothetical protein